MAGPMSQKLSMADKQTLSMGSEALMSGKVTPEEVQSAAATLATDQTWLQSYLKENKNKKDPYTFKSSSDVKVGDKKQSKTASKVNREEKTSLTKNTYLGQPQFEDLTEQVRSTPEVMSLQKGVEDMEGMLNMQRMQEGDNSDYWVRPLTALADSVNPGSKLMQGYQGTPTQGDRNKQMLSTMDALTKRKEDLAKTVLDGVGKMKSGTESNSQMNSMMQQMGFMSGQLGGALSGVRGQKLLADAAGQFDKDKRLQNYENTFDSLDRAHSILYGDVPVTSALYNTLQEDFTRAITGGGNQMADAKLKREAIHTLQETLNKAAAYGGRIKDLRKAEPEIFKQLQGLEKKVREDYLKSYNQRITQLSQNYKHADPQLRLAAEDKAKELREMRGITDASILHNAPDRAAKEEKYFSKTSPGKTPPAPGGLTPEEKKRLEELRAKRGS